MKSVRLAAPLALVKRLSLTMMLALFLSVVPVVPRLHQLDAHWSADEARWLRRSAVFMDSVKRGRFERTLIAYHPGVMTMWLAGLRAFLLDKLTWRSLTDLLFARYFVGVAVLSGFVATFFLLIRLFRFWSATFAWGFLVSNPFFLAQSRRVHTDALAAVFILLTVLLFLLYCERPKKLRYLIFSGVVFGLACLSKSYSLILLLWIPICLFLYRQSNTSWREFLYTSFRSNFLFLNCGLLTVFVLWPVFWTPAFLLLGLCLGGLTIFVCQTFKEEVPSRPLSVVAAFSVFLAINVCAIKVILLVFDRITWALTIAHEVEHFFLGNVVHDPGWFFYPFVLSIKSTPFTIPLAISGYVLLCSQRKEAHKRTPHLRIAFSLICGVLLFMLCLSVTAKKFSRYLLPVFPMLDVLAGIGLFYTVKWICRWVKKSYFRRVAHAACAVLILLLTVVPVFALHPYYGTYYNICWKVTDITAIITFGDASGLDIAAKYINKKPNASQMSVQVSPLATEFFQYYFVGTAYRPDKIYSGDASERLHADYEVVYIRDSQIGRVPQEGTRAGELEHTITLNGIDHAWVYRVTQEGNR